MAFQVGERKSTKAKEKQAWGAYHNRSRRGGLQARPSHQRFQKWYGLLFGGVCSEHLAEPVINLANAPEKAQGLNACPSITGEAAAGRITGVSARPEDQEFGT